MSATTRGAVIAFNKQTGQDKTKLNLGDCIALADAKGKKDEFISIIGKWDGSKQHLDQQDLTIKQFMSELGEQVDLSVLDKTKGISGIFNTLTEKDTNRKSQRGAKHLSIGDIHYVYSRLNITDKFASVSTAWQPKRSLHVQTEELQSSIYEAVSAVKTDDVVSDKKEDETQ